MVLIGTEQEKEVPMKRLLMSIAAAGLLLGAPASAENQSTETASSAQSAPMLPDGYQGWPKQVVPCGQLTVSHYMLPEFDDNGGTVHRVDTFKINEGEVTAFVLRVQGQDGRLDFLTGAKYGDEWYHISNKSRDPDSGLPETSALLLRGAVEDVGASLWWYENRACAVADKTAELARESGEAVDEALRQTEQQYRLAKDMLIIWGEGVKQQLDELLGKTPLAE